MSVSTQQHRRTPGPVSRFGTFLLSEFVLMTVVWLIVGALVSQPTGVLVAYAVGLLYLMTTVARVALRRRRAGR